MSRYRKWIVAAALMGLVAWGTLSRSDPVIRPLYDTGNRAFDFVRALDTLCAAVGDTTMGPSVYCFGASRVIFRLQANAGTCSTLTVQVSMNDTTYFAASGKTTTTIVSDFAVGDSLNAGGVTTILVPLTDAVPTSNGVIPWRYARMFARQRTGYTTGTASAGPTVACRTRADSLRWKVYAVWPNQ